MVAVPKQEYLYGTRSSLGDTASFGLDYGEIYKRSVIGIRVYGVPPAEKDALRGFFKRLNDDYARQASVTDYHRGDISYDYMNLNCAKTIGAAFKHGAGYHTLRCATRCRCPRWCAPSPRCRPTSPPRWR